MVGDDSGQIPDLGLLRRLGNCTVLNQHFPNPKSNKNPKIFSEKSKSDQTRKARGVWVWVGVGVGVGTEERGEEN